MSCLRKIDSFGAKPSNIKWSITRGDTAVLRIDFLYNDESTYWNTSNWTYTSTAYDPVSDVLDELLVESNNGYAVITAPAEITANWGTGYKNVVSEIMFDLQVLIPRTGQDDFVWTPVAGTICVIGDISGGL